MPCPAIFTQIAVDLCWLGCSLLHFTLQVPQPSVNVLLEQLLSVQQTTEISLYMPAQETALLRDYEDNNHKDCSTAVMLIFPKTQRNIELAESPFLPQAPLASAGWQEGGLRIDVLYVFS